MKNYFYIGIGGLIGAISRFAVKNIKLYHYSGIIPLNTLIVNITGSFILAFFLTFAFQTCKVREEIRLGVAAGVLGAYTTFSTLCKETVELMLKGFLLHAVLYVTSSVVLGLAAAYLGVLSAKKAFTKPAKA